VNQKLHILVVDDQESVLLTYVLILQHVGYEVTSASTYTAALGKLEDERYDLLLCDFVLDDGHNGLDVIDVARTRCPHILSLLLTGYSSPDIIEEAERRRLALLFKPVAVRELLRTLQGLVCADKAA